MKWYFDVLFLLIILIITSCSDVKQQLQIDRCELIESVPVNQDRLSSRFIPPADYKRMVENEHSFQDYLRNLRLKPKHSTVKYYDGSIKPNHEVYCAVVDLPIGQKNLHQCADAIMRLRAEYLWNSEQYDEIHFHFTNGFKVEYKEWMHGRRVVVQGNETFWSDRSSFSNKYEDLWDYLELIFMYAGTSSLEKELVSIHAEEANIGDVLIQGGFPGHALIIVDEVKNVDTNHSLYLLAQSYMPAQELQILRNPSNELNPWYDLSTEVIETPEWQFTKDNFMRFQD